MVIPRCKQLAYSLTQNVNNSVVGYWFVMCDLSMQLAGEFIFPNSTGVVFIINHRKITAIVHLKCIYVNG